MTIGYYEKKENSNNKLDQNAAAKCRYCAYATPAATYSETSPHAAPQAYEIKSCWGALCNGFISPILSPANRGTPGTTHVTIIKNYF